MEKLKSALAFGGILSTVDIESVASNFRHLTVKSEDYVQDLHEIASEIIFVESGILRLFGADARGDDVTKHFIRENQFFANLESYYSRQPATESIQAVAGCELHMIKFSVLEQLFADVPNLYIFFKSISEATLLNKIKDNDFLNFGDSTTKYTELMRRYPELVQQVPQQYLASYLKITPQSLSRIRRSLR
ncbi:Crp/Fnr family transcriptional regulator [Dyadobacter crusticola]|uniref:Crp/Fnr family transcriptional regulator n=1 Tax=Dyadobacter crusticola TaxID=292407 RepID=UPI0004E1F413|nr:cyclic nucleotide-binding domain-containing protein [Dyadobacter crusticola]